MVQGVSYHTLVMCTVHTSALLQITHDASALPCHSAVCSPVTVFCTSRCITTNRMSSPSEPLLLSSLCDVPSSNMQQCSLASDACCMRERVPLQEVASGLTGIAKHELFRPGQLPGIAAESPGSDTVPYNACGGRWQCREPVSHQSHPRPCKHPSSLGPSCTSSIFTSETSLRLPSCIRLGA